MILGSTGSIGTQAVDVIEAHPEVFKLVGVAAYGHFKDVAAQIKRHHLNLACMVEEGAAEKVRDAVGPSCRVFPEARAC